MSISERPGQRAKCSHFQLKTKVFKFKIFFKRWSKTQNFVNHVIINFFFRNSSQLLAKLGFINSRLLSMCTRYDPVNLFHSTDFFFYPLKTWKRQNTRVFQRMRMIMLWQLFNIHHFTHPIFVMSSMITKVKKWRRCIFKMINEWINGNLY